MRRFFQNPLKAALIILIIAGCLALIIQFVSQNENTNSLSQIKEAEKKLVSLEGEMISTFENIERLSNEKEYNDYFKNSDPESGFSYYVLINDTLKFWSDNEPAITDSMLSSIRDRELLHLSNGDFLSYSKENSGRKIVGLILLRHSYDYENKYLVNGFNPVLGLGKDFFISNPGDTFHLLGNQPAYVLGRHLIGNKESSDLFAGLNFLIAVLVLISIFLFIRHFSTSSIKIFLFVLLIFGLRTLMLYLKIPSALYDHGIFSPSFYASSFYFNSLGDMLLNASLLLIFSITLYEGIRTGKKYRTLLILFWIISALCIHFLIRGLVINSKISFVLTDPSDINLYSILAFSSVSILLLCFLFMSAAVLRNLNGYVITGQHGWMGISICALYTAIVLTGINKEKELDTRKVIAHKAEMSQDQIAEYLFREQEDKIMADTLIGGILHSGKNGDDELASYLSQKYFSGYLSKFNLSVQDFDEKNRGDSVINLEYFQRKTQQGKTTNSSRLFFVNDETGGTSYLAILPLNEPEHKHSLVISLTARFLHSTRGFPELFMSGRYEENSPSDEYSLARYTGQSLDYEYGNYVYPLTGKEFIQSQDEFSYQETKYYNHLIHRINSNSFIVVSKAKGNLFDVLTMFSWMFTFLSIMAFIVFIFSGIFGDGSALQLNLTKRVQVSVIFLVVLTFILVGTGTVYYINRKYVNDQRKSISDQVNALWFMVRENSLPFIMNENNGNQFEELDRLVSNTNIDFNIFNGNGKLVYSSQPKIFDKGIISKQMNPGAYFRIMDKGLTQYIHPENVGQLKYIAGYAPFTDRSGNIIAFLNLPYFEKQNELNKEVSVFLSALVNIYVLLFSLAVIVTLFITSRITKPLLLIQEKMSGMRLGAINEKIAYKEKDEIGQLVHEYNRMIEELSVSAGKLAQSERETAWREMARQVAHEIKNPLTPMKLSVQHLNRTFKDKGYGDDQHVDKITSTLIQQIDTLSNIATAFSNFAQMPQPVPVKIDLKEVLNQMVSLYSEGVEISMIAHDEKYFVMADKDQMVGIFSNLLKNAIQSIPAERRGLIGITLSRQPGSITVEIADNGIGIPEDQRDKIFIPNFTTKSSGMGLGLAIVRNIVQEASGDIWFTSIYEKGSSFFIRLPEIR